MPRLAVLNMAIGFGVLVLAAAAGAFIATDLTRAHLMDKEQIASWALLLQSSAHGHTNLFATVHICFALTLPYSVLPRRVKIWQTAGLSLGTFAMSIGMLVRSYLGPRAGIDPLELVIGVMLSCALAALALHAYGLAAKLHRIR